MRKPIQMKRKQSSRLSNNDTILNVKKSRNINQKLLTIGQKRSSTRSCTLCNMSGCEKFSCPKITDVYGSPLPKNNETSRTNLAYSIGLPDTHVTLILPTTLYETIWTEFPKQFGAIILFQRYLRENVSPLHKYVIKCTVLDKKGNLQKIYDNQLFESACLAKAINSSKTNVVVNKLDSP